MRDEYKDETRRCPFNPHTFTFILIPSPCSVLKHFCMLCWAASCRFSFGCGFGKEDAHHPEPRGLIMLSFIAGMAVIAIAIPLEKLAYNALPDRTHLLIAWAVIEEMLKFAAVLFVAIRSRFLTNLETHSSI